MLGGSVQAQVIMPGSVSFDAGTSIYTYSYSVTNNGPNFDLAIINVPVGGTPMNLMSPSGFEISFDPGVGIVSFFEDFDPGTLPTFAPATTNGVFSFTSPLAPISVTFDALDVGGNTFTGPTLSPIPELGAISLLVPALRRHRRKSSSASTSNPNL